MVRRKVLDQEPPPPPPPEPPKKRIRINPPIKRNTFDYQASLDVIGRAIDEIFNKSNASGLSFEELYRHAYNLVQNRYGRELYGTFNERLTRHLQRLRDAVFAAPSGLLLGVLNSEWLDFTRALQVIRVILSHLERSELKKHAVYEAGTELWRDGVITSAEIRGKLTEKLLEEIRRERNGEMIDRSMMRNIVHMMIELDKQIYESVLESHLTVSTVEYYSLESQELLMWNDASEILTRAEKRVAEEAARVSGYLAKQTGSVLTRIVIDCLVSRNMKRLADMETTGLRFMLSNDRLEDLHKMYFLFKSEPEGMNIIKEGLDKHVSSMGCSLMQDAEKQKDPISYIQLLVDFRQKYDVILSSSFANDKTLAAAVNNTITRLVNTNKRLPEFLSLYVDTKLRRAGDKSSDEDHETALDKCMSIFGSLEEKDLFEKYYKQHLAKRLLYTRNVEDESERNLILKMKSACGYYFTSKLENMLKDVKTSQDLMSEFDRETPSVLQVQVLTTGSWPAYPSTSCQVPREIQAVMDKFKVFYLNKYRGRRLTWQNNLGTADLKMTVGGTTKFLNVTTYQMVILMLFNDTDKLSYKEIHESTDIPHTELKRNLQSLSLVKGKNVLRKEVMSKDIRESDVFVFNDKFTNKLTRIKIGVVTGQRETQEESEETRRRLNDDRKPQIEAAVVRVMKARKVMEHNSLISEVIEQVKSRFMPNPTDIKKRIEGLIEREFIERDRDDMKMYRYLA